MFHLGVTNGCKGPSVLAYTVTFIYLFIYLFIYFLNYLRWTLIMALTAVHKSTRVHNQV